MPHDEDVCPYPQPAGFWSWRHFLDSIRPRSEGWSSHDGWRYVKLRFNHPGWEHGYRDLDGWLTGWIVPQYEWIEVTWTVCPADCGSAWCPHPQHPPCRHPGVDFNYDGACPHCGAQGSPG